MNEEYLLTVLQAPHLSEKAMSRDRQYVFRVLKSANKTQIKDAVEKLFEVSVEKVSILNVKEKAVRFRQKVGSHKGWKKAYIKLAVGSQIDLAAAQS